MTEAYIVAATRTAGGRRGGRLSGWHPVDLAAQVLNELVGRAAIDPALVDDVILGCVSQVGEQSSNVARNAVLASKLPESVPGTSIDRQCGSSQQALHFAAQAVMAGTMDVVIAAGVESMSRVPLGTPSTLAQKNGMGYYMSPAMRKHYKADFNQFLGAEMIAKKYGLSREHLDEFSFNSHQLAIKATKESLFEDEILPIEVRLGDGGATGEMHKVDEGIRFDVTRDGIRGVKLIQEDGVISAASASQICDGASGVMVVNESALNRFGLKPMARIHQMTMMGHDPVVMLEAPIPATNQALKKAGMKIEDIDIYEVNEAFAPVPLAWLKATGADPRRLNVNGGAIALGHPLGASGTKLATTLLYAMAQRKARYGLQTMCEGGGMANVTIIELI